MSSREEIIDREKRLEREKLNRAKADAHEAQLRRDRQRLMTSPEFRRVAADILKRGGMFQSVMTGNSMTYYQAGRQDLTREIWTTLAEADKGLAFDLLKTEEFDV
jgi:hypothetical protein